MKCRTARGAFQRCSERLHTRTVNIVRALNTLALLAVSGCVPIPYHDARTPAVSGRVVGSSSRTPLAGATVEFLDHDGRAVSRPRSSTDASGRFALPRSYNYYAGAHPAAHAMEGWPSGVECHLLRISLSCYRPRIFDIDAAGQAQGLRTKYWQNAQSRFNSIYYEGTISLGDIPLNR